METIKASQGGHPTWVASVLRDMTATEVMQRENDMYAARAALAKASIPMTYSGTTATLVVMDDPVEEDTYSLIANGTEVTYTQGYNDGAGIRIMSYLVQHDQSGDTIKWCGRSEDSYYEHYNDERYDYGDHPLENFETFLGWHKRQRKKWKESWLKKLRAEPKVTAMSYDPYYDGPCDCEECMPSLYISPAKKAKKGSTMNTAAATIIAQPDTTAADQRRHLGYRMRDVRAKHYETLRTTFKVNPVKGPRTLEEFVAKIKSDDFTMPEQYKDYTFYGPEQIADMIRWTKEPADQKGYEAAEKKLSQAYQDLEDTITIMSPEEGLKALRDFASATFH